ncbi:MAG: exodeoxyribonuclease 7 large subunit [Candidatus Binatia bacterium]|nr:MAG: exodeoxyribonuclease 7 large subunit [Candidatus Binatia bacterium]
MGPLAVPAARLLSVTEAARRIQGALDSGLSELWVVGEISNFRASANGHFYFILKDDRSQLAAVMFRYSNQALPFRPRDGMEVIVRGRVGLYEARGALQLYVEWMEPRGLGAQLLALEELKRKLAAEGLFDPARKRPLPRFPAAIGIVTTIHGAALHDMLVTLRKRWPLARVVVHPVRVQGKLAAGEIVEALRRIARVPWIDVVLLGRGGGSVEDLWAFNEEAVARAVAGCPIPVVSAVGHEIDTTLADLAADERAATPTAAAAAATPEVRELLQDLDDGRERLLGAVLRRLEAASGVVRALEARLRHPREALDRNDARLRELSERATRAIRQRLSLLQERVSAYENRLRALSPLAVLERGYALVRRPDGHVLRRAADAELGEELSVTLAEGRIRVRVEERETPEKET